MAKGYITFEFDTLGDLEAQMRTALGLRADRPFASTQLAPEVQQIPDTVRGVLGKVGDGMSSGRNAPPTIDEVRAFNQKAVAAHIEAEKALVVETLPILNATLAAAAGVPPALSPVAQAVVDTAQETNHAADTATGIPATAPTVTLETLSTVEYSILLAFCDAHPEVGVNTATCQAAFFRKLVEHKVKTYLETK